MSIRQKFLAHPCLWNIIGPLRNLPQMHLAPKPKSSVTLSSSLLQVLHLFSLEFPSDPILCSQSFADAIDGPYGITIAHEFFSLCTLRVLLLLVQTDVESTRVIVLRLLVISPHVVLP